MTVILWPSALSFRISLAQETVWSALAGFASQIGFLLAALAITPSVLVVPFLSVCVLASGFQAWHLVHLGCVFNEGTLEATLRSPGSESREFILSNLGWIVYAFGGCLGAATTGRLWVIRPANRLRLSCLVAAFAATAPCAAIDNFRMHSSDGAGPATRLLRRLSDSSPLGIIATGLEVLASRRDLAARLAVPPAPEHPTCPDLARAPFFVLVLGEATRADAVGLCSGDTGVSPLLDRELSRGASLWCGVRAPSNITHASLPRLLAASRIASHAPLARPTVVDIYRQCGFRTVWIDNQPVDAASTPEIWRAVRGVDTLVRLCPAGSSAPHWDSRTVPVLEGILSGPRVPTLVVVHLMGCHWRYPDRHPPDSVAFASRLDSGSATLDGMPTRDLRDAYRNAMREQDRALAGLVGLFRKSGREGSLLYVPDHGENLRDDGRNLTLHGGAHPSRWEFEVAAFAVSPRDSSLVVSHATLSAERTAPSLLRWAGIGGADHGIPSFDSGSDTAPMAWVPGRGLVRADRP